MHASETPCAAAPIHLPTIAPNIAQTTTQRANTHPLAWTPPPIRQGCRPCRSDFGLCIAHRSRFLDPDTRLHDENCR